jgi:hypothetical protein
VLGGVVRNFFGQNLYLIIMESHQELRASIEPQRTLLLLGKNISETGCATRSFEALDFFFVVVVVRCIKESCGRTCR